MGMHVEEDATLSIEKDPKSLFLARGMELNFQRGSKIPEIELE